MRWHDRNPARTAEGQACLVGVPAEGCSSPGMDPESVAFQPRDDLWRFQDEMLSVQQTQAELIDRVSRLERRQEDESRMKNVWGTSSPFPSVLTGTPQQGAIFPQVSRALS